MAARQPAVPDDVLALAEELRAALRHLYRQAQREKHASSGLSPLYRLLLTSLLEHPGIGVGELARLEKLRGPTISGHVKAMEAAGLVSRMAAPSGDRRRVGLAVTAKGRRLVEKFRKQRLDWLAQQLAALEPDARAAIRRALGPLSEIGA